jgi:hypothetical protein
VDGEHHDLPAERRSGLQRGRGAAELAGELLRFRHVASRISTWWPPATARVPMPRPMLPAPTIVTLIPTLLLAPSNECCPVNSAETTLPALRDTRLEALCPFLDQLLSPLPDRGIPLYDLDASVGRQRRNASSTTRRNVRYIAKVKWSGRPPAGLAARAPWSGCHRSAGPTAPGRPAGVRPVGHRGRVPTGWPAMAGVDQDRSPVAVVDANHP